ncbi:hypothetical protein ACFO0N_11365 [Halobium salinum]|uniref:DUF8116 domain-containing protein n=1 Tax=Halobium salinum TaxID=1364940 RepID=A0ABD5PCC7_9EURY|nr:hypothetical protein [Halobium salinum]
MTVLSLLSLRTPADFADWYRLGAEYVHDVAEEMAFDLGTFPEAYPETVAALRTGDDLDPRAARSVAADFLADATYTEPYCEWMPLWYELGLLPFGRIAERKLRSAAGTVARRTGVEPVSAPRFSRPRDVYVGGCPASRFVGDLGFAERFVVADALLHLEWFVHVARESGVEVPPDLVARTREETLSHYLADGDLSPQVRRFQRALFADDAWVRGVDDAYGLDSALFGVWEGILRRERERLATDA